MTPASGADMFICSLIIGACVIAAGFIVARALLLVGQAIIEIDEKEETQDD